MLKQDFRDIYDEEIEYHGKRFEGKNDDEKEASRKKFLFRHYEILSHCSESQLKLAFKKCREIFEYFPKPNQLLKFAPRPFVAEAEYQEPEYIEPAPEVAKAIAEARKKGILKKVGAEQLRINAAHCQTRWPDSNWEEVLSRWIKQDEAGIK